MRRTLHYLPSFVFGRERLTREILARRTHTHTHGTRAEAMPHAWEPLTRLQLSNVTESQTRGTSCVVPSGSARSHLLSLSLSTLSAVVPPLHAACPLHLEVLLRLLLVSFLLLPYTYPLCSLLLFLSFSAELFTFCDPEVGWLIYLLATKIAREFRVSFLPPPVPLLDCHKWIF